MGNLQKFTMGVGGMADSLSPLLPSFKKNIDNGDCLDVRMNSGRRRKSWVHDRLVVLGD